jgi:hypothetical protein
MHSAAARPVSSSHACQHWAALVCPQARRARLLHAPACPRSRARCGARSCPACWCTGRGAAFLAHATGPPCVRDAQARGLRRRVGVAARSRGPGSGQRRAPRARSLARFPHCQAAGMLHRPELEPCDMGTTGPGWSCPTRTPAGGAGAVRRALHGAELDAATMAAVLERATCPSWRCRTRAPPSALAGGAC